MISFCSWYNCQSQCLSPLPWERIWIFSSGPIIALYCIRKVSGSRVIMGPNGVNWVLRVLNIWDKSLFFPLRVLRIWLFKSDQTPTNMKNVCLQMDPSGHKGRALTVLCNLWSLFGLQRKSLLKMLVTWACPYFFFCYSDSWEVFLNSVQSVQ